MEELKQSSDDVFEQIKKLLSDSVYDQIKDFDCKKLTEKQGLLVDKLILDEELKNNYKDYGLCEKCKQPKNNYNWCLCANKYFQQNFKNWTSGNHDVDKFIQKTQLKATTDEEIIEWIEYDRFENVEYLAKGGFGTVYKAIWKDGSIRKCELKKWKRCGSIEVALKSLHNSQDISSEFFSEIESHTMTTHACIIRCYGITKDPETNNFMMVMEYAENGSLRQLLNNSFNSLNWKAKLYNLNTIADGLKTIHKNGIIHHDFHCGNILNSNDYDHTYSVITDLGLCKPANEKPEKCDKKVYGVLPYVAPEVLRGKEYTQASDVYGFGIIAYEMCTGLPPYHDISHDEFLAIRICQGLRPNSNYKIPQLTLNTIQQCWDADPLKRPKASELRRIFWEWYCKGDDKDSEISKQIEEADEFNKTQVSPMNSLNTKLTYTTHPQAIYTSRLLKFENLPEPKNADDDFSESTMISTKIDFANFNIDS